MFFLFIKTVILFSNFNRFFCKSKHPPVRLGDAYFDIFCPFQSSAKSESNFVSCTVPNECLDGAYTEYTFNGHEHAFMILCHVPDGITIA